MKRRLVVFSIFFAAFVMFASSITFAAWDKPCNVKKIVRENFWCDICKVVRHTYPNCPDKVDAIWNLAEHESKENPHTKLREIWACEKVSFSCINTECEDYGKCISHPGSCDTCMDDFTSKGIYSRVLFHCSKCNKDWEEAGVGHKLDLKKEYVHTLLETGTCPDDGTKLVSVCTLSGTCPHVSY
ncbi:MAG: hypothetical protein ACUZ8O_16535 [Candidatus Anammoxibacter sp.]